MGHFDPQPILAGLRDFQRQTADYVIRRFYEDVDATRRFLVADPVGMGKTYVARGVIARAIERLEADSSVPRIDIVYVCSNLDIANQNIRRLNVVDGRNREPVRRLTLLATQAQNLNRRRDDGGKIINFVAFTPGTSFELASKGGIAQERALLHLLLAEAYDLSRAEKTASKRLLQGGVSTAERFQQTIDYVKWLTEAGIDPDIKRAFLRSATISEAGHRYRQLVSDVARGRPTKAQLSDVKPVVGDLRRALARASIDALQPDLVILDEFQRFKHLLDRKVGGEAAELAHELFEYPDARVLLLSATPYKMYTLAEESALGEDHQEDFIETIRFLGDTIMLSPDSIQSRFGDLRTTLVRGSPTVEIAARLSDDLRKVMCRTERPDLDGQGTVTEVRESVGSVLPDDLLGYVAIRRLADELDSAQSIEHWKSVAYFLNFSEGYQLGERLQEALQDDGRRDELLRTAALAQRLHRDRINRYRPIDLGNPKLRHLATQTVDAGWWKLLWLPPSMPYYRSSGPWAEKGVATGMTKRVIFSSWAAAPTSIASLLSYDAERRSAGTKEVDDSESRGVARRLNFRITAGHPGAMTTLALIWPFPTLAELCDPLKFARDAPDQVLPFEQIRKKATAAVRSSFGADGRSVSNRSEAWYWTAPLGADHELASTVANAPLSTLTEALRGGTEGDESEPQEQVQLTEHIQLALRTLRGESPSSPRPRGFARNLALLGLAAPGNVAWRALSRILTPGNTVTTFGRWRAAALLASGFRMLFNRPESTRLIDLLLPDGPYWRNVLQYCAWGNLQAVLDEYLHHFVEDQGIQPIDDTALWSVAERVRGAITLRPASYRAFDPENPESSLRFPSRFALRYGTKRQKDDDARLPELRSAFNSPFRPFVLATTSIGQEGIDFHWWCHAIVHWNIPPNPVDLEQREGRITRYKGHAIRKNVAAAHRSDALRSAEPDPWRAAFAAAAERRPPGTNELFPSWVYPGSATIERHVPQVPLSRDIQRYRQVRDTLTLYRMAFGQPRQEDLVALLRRLGVSHPTEGSTGLIDLRPQPSEAPVR